MMNEREVWMQIGNKLHNLRVQQGFKQEAFAKELGMSERSYGPIERGNPPSKISKAKLVTWLESNKLMGKFVEHFNLLESIKGGVKVLEDFESLASCLRIVDQNVLKIVRSQDREYFTEDELADEHRAFLNGKLAESGLTIIDLIAHLQDKHQIDRIVKTIPKPGLIVDVSERLERSRFERLVYHTGDRTLLELPDARLLWDCPCRSRSIRNSKCKIHSSPNWKELERLFFNGLVEIRWRGFRFLWRNGPESWPPAIDAFLMASTLEEVGAFCADCRTILDIGAGTGFLGIVASHYSEEVEKLLLWDWLLTPILYGAINWQLNQVNSHLKTSRKYVSVHNLLGINERSFRGDVLFSPPFDVVLCNPPYLPVPDAFRKYSFESTTTGTDLLEYVLSRNQAIGKRVFLQYSRLARKEAEKAQLKAQCGLTRLAQHLVPCRIHDVGKYPDYLNSLLHENRGITSKDGRLWHWLDTFKLT